MLDVLTGRLFQVRRENEREAFQSYRRDRNQREEVYGEQRKERVALQSRIDAMQSRHRQDRMRLAAQIASLLRDRAEEEPVREQHHRRRGHEPEPR